MSRTLELLERLVAFPTVSRDSNLALIDWAQSLLQAAGFKVTRIPSPDGNKAGLHARIGPDGPGGICLSGHTDVVPTDGQAWTRDPFRLTRDETHVYGRGTTDMKGFVACVLAMAERARHIDLQEPLSIVLSYDEEIGCVGLRDMLPDLVPLMHHPRLIIVGEPTSMQVATGHKGKAALKVTCTGEAGHSALAPDYVNAIHIAADFVQDIRGLQDRLALGPRDAAYSIPYSTVHIGKIHGGRALNIVPDTVDLEMEFRHLAQTPMAHILRDIEDVAQQISQKNPTVPPITIKLVNSYPGLNSDLSDDVIDWVQSMARAQGTTKVPFGTEAGFFAELGFGTVVVGPGDMASDGHKPDEGLAQAQLFACDAMMDEILNTLAERSGSLPGNA